MLPIWKSPPGTQTCFTGTACIGSSRHVALAVSMPNWGIETSSVAQQKPGLHPACVISRFSFSSSPVEVGTHASSTHNKCPLILAAKHSSHSGDVWLYWSLKSSQLGGCRSVLMHVFHLETVFRSRPRMPFSTGIMWCIYIPTHLMRWHKAQPQYQWVML